MMNTFFLYLLFLTTHSWSLASAEDSICYSSDHAFLTRAPDDWGTEFKESKKNGLCVAYVVEGKTFHNSPVVIYPRIGANVPLKSNGEADLDAFVKEDISSYSEKLVKANVTDSKLILKPNGFNVIIKDFKNGPAPIEFETVAYMASGKDVFVAVLSARNEKDLEKYSKAFVSFVDNVKVFSRKDLYQYLKNKTTEAVKTLKGKAFDENYTISIGQSLHQAIMECAKAHPKISKFEGVMTVLSDGTLSDFMLEDENLLGACFVAKIKGAKGLKPESSTAYVFLKVNVRK